VRALDVRERALTELRARTGTLLGAASLVASFLGAQAIQHTSEVGTLGALALLALAVSIGACTYVLLPKREFVFSLDGTKLFEELYDFRGDPPELRRRLTYWLESFWRANQDKVEDLSRWFLAAAVGLLGQLVFWTWSLADTI
jgi:hypothetical protein